MFADYSFLLSRQGQFVCDLPALEGHSFVVEHSVNSFSMAWVYSVANIQARPIRHRYSLPLLEGQWEACCRSRRADPRRMGDQIWIFGEGPLLPPHSAAYRQLDTMRFGTRSVLFLAIIGPLEVPYSLGLGLVLSNWLQTVRGHCFKRGAHTCRDRFHRTIIDYCVCTYPMTNVS
jgi:hypothetical protein